MNVVIAGAGEVGRHAAEILGAAGHNITMIDLSPQKLRKLEDSLDIRSLAGNCAHAEVITEAGGATCDVFLAATNRDEINLLTASVAKGLGARQTLARVHHSAYFSARGIDYRVHLGIDELICPDYLTGRAIARTLSNPGAMAVENFARGAIEMQQLRIDKTDPALDVPLSELALPSGVRVAVIQRNGVAFLPDGLSRILDGDVVTLIGEPNGFEKAHSLLKISKAARRNVVLMGGSPIAVWLCRALNRRDFSVRLFETDRVRAEELASKLEHVTVVQADAIEPAVFAEEHLGSTDAFVALTADDEHNILAAAQAKSMGATRAIVVLQRPTYMHLLPHVGIDHAFSAPSVAIKEIQSLMDPRPVRKLATLAEGIADVYEIHPKRKAKVLGYELRNVKFPPKCMIAAIQRGDDVTVPDGEATIQAGDTLIAIGRSGIEKELRKLFTGK